MMVDCSLSDMLSSDENRGSSIIGSEEYWGWRLFHLGSAWRGGANEGEAEVREGCDDEGGQITKSDMLAVCWWCGC